MLALLKFIKEKNRTTPNWLKVLLPLLATGGLGVIVIIAGITAFIITAWFGQPIPTLGFEQTVEQPIAFPHTIHAGTQQLLNTDGTDVTGIGLDCTYCHRTVTKQPNAGVPAVELCAFCHRVVGTETNVEISKLRDATGIVGRPVEPINWRRVHRLPDHVRFVHSAHIQYLMGNPSAIRNSPDAETTSLESVRPAKVCSTCHGNVAAMEQVHQVEPLKMGQCVNCHRDNGAPTDCAVCHH